MEDKSLLSSLQEYVDNAIEYVGIRKKLNNFLTRKAETVVILEKDDNIFAEVAGIAYIEPQSRSFVIFKDWLLVQPEYNEPNHCVYVNHKKKCVLIGYRGTVATQMKDIASDVQIVLGVASVDKRLKDSLALYDDIRQKYPHYKKYITGHSLGGTICYLVAKHRNPDRCVVFNPGGSLNQLFLHMLIETIQQQERTQKVYTYKILGDPISSFSFVGNTRIFALPKMDPMSLHRLTNFLHDTHPSESHETSKSGN